MLTKLLLVLLLLLCPWTSAYAAPPAGAVADSRYALGYLVCTYYSGVAANETGNSTTGLQNCINDGWTYGLTAFLPEGTYLINDTLRLYEWQNWSGSAVLNPDPRVHSVRGSKIGTGATLKLIASSTGFTNASSPKPMMAIRNFLALNNSAVANAIPSNPLGLPANYKDGQANQFSVVVENIKFDTNDNAGAIGLTAPTAQNSGIYSITVDASNSFAGIYGLPGRNSSAVNLSVTGGQHCVGSGSVWGVSLDNSIGNFLANVTCAGQTGTAVEINDTVPTVITGLSITTSAGVPPLRVRSPFVLVDAKFTQTGSAVNQISIDNPDGYTMYARNVFTNGTTSAIRSSTTTTPVSGTWAKVLEYSYSNQTQIPAGGTPQADVYPTYTAPASQFETRSVVNGVLSGSAFPIAPLTQNSSASPPTDLLSRHGWTSLPSFEDGTYLVPSCTATVVTPGYGQDGTDGNTGQDCTAALQTAIDNAATAGHNRVHLPHGVIAVSGSVNLKPDTKLMGAGIGLINMIAYKSTWSPTSETYYLTTDSSATGTAYMGFFSLFARTSPVTSQYTGFWHWRVGKNSLTVNLGYEKQHEKPEYSTNNIKMVRFSGNGGGRHYGVHNSFEQYDSNIGARMIYAQDTTQPLTLYGQNIEITKLSTDSAAYALSNIEFVNVSNARIYGCKREGESPNLIASDSDNIAMFGCGAMSLPIRAGMAGWYQFTGTTSNVLTAVNQVRDIKNNPNGTVMIREAITGQTAFSMVPYPNGLSLYKRGTIDDSPFADAATPPATAPVLRTAIVNVNDRLDVTWDTFDSIAMTPASSATGFTVTIDGVSKAITSSALVGLNTYQLNFAASTITDGNQAVVVSYSAAGNIKGGGVGTPAATAFTNVTASNLLVPTPNPYYTQAAFAFRQIYGDETMAESPYYANEASTYENINARFIQGASFRLRFKVVNTIAAANAQPFYLCVSENGGAYSLLTDSCTSANTCFVDAPDLPNGVPTTEQLTEVQSTFVPGGLLESSTEQVPVILPQNSETEYEAAIQFKTDVPVGNTYDYRICRAGGAALNTYTNTPRVTVITKRSAQVGGGTRQ